MILQHYDLDIERQHAIASTWLQRSGSRPLSFRYSQNISYSTDSIGPGSPNDSSGGDALPNMGDVQRGGESERWRTLTSTSRLLESEQQRWRDAEISLDGLMGRNPFRLTLSNLPCLVKLNLTVQESELKSFWGSTSRHQANPFGIHRSQAHQLPATIVFPDIRLCGGKAIAPNLTRLRLCLFSFASARVAYHTRCFLRHCPLLEELSLELCVNLDVEPADGDDDTTIQLTRLHKFDISIEADDLPFFLHLWTPVLKEFAFLRVSFWSIYADFLGFVKLTEPPIKKFEVEGVRDEEIDSDMVSVLRALPTVEFLSIAWEEIDIFLWQALTSSENNPKDLLLPNLRNVRIDLCNLRDYSEVFDAIKELAATRFQTAPFKMEFVSLLKAGRDQARSFRERNPRLWSRIKHLISFE